MTILPSLLYPDINQMRARFEECVGVCDEVHVDFADGIFVQNVLPDAESVRGFVGAIEMEAHLMVQSPDSWIDSLLEDERFARIIVHAESDGDMVNMLQKIRRAGRKAGVALRPETSVEMIAPWRDLLDQVLVLFVDPGFNGSPFIPEMAKKIAELKKQMPSIEISADGGINPDTLAVVRGAGVDRVAVGSWLHDKSLEAGLSELQGVVSGEGV